MWSCVENSCYCYVYAVLIILNIIIKYIWRCTSMSTSDRRLVSMGSQVEGKWNASK